MASLGASLRFVSQKLISPTAQADLQSYLTVLRPSSNTIRSANPYALYNWNYFGVLYGNAFSSEQGFATVGTLGNGVAWDASNNVFPLMSMAKPFVKAVFGKMVEEGLMDSNDTIATYITTGFSGNMVYINNGFEGNAEININGQTGSPAAWTVSTGSFDASTLTINTLLNYNFGLLDDGYQYGIYAPSITLNATGVVQNDGIAGTSYGKNMLYNAYALNSYVQANPTTNYVYQVMSGTYINYRNYIYNLLNQVANGTIPLAFRPNTNALDGQTFGSTSFANTTEATQPPSWVTQQLAQSSPATEILGICMDNKLRALYASDPVTYPYYNFAAYARAKFLTPLQMTRTYVVNQELPDVSSPVPNIATLRYSVPQWLCTPQVNRADVVGVANLLSNNFSNVTVASQYGSASGANLYYACLYGNDGITGTHTVYSLAGTGYSYNVDDDSFVKYGNKMFNSTAVPSDAPIGGAALVSSFNDYAKFVVMLLNGGKSQGGQRVLNKQTIEWLFANRTAALTPVYKPNNLAPSNTVVCNAGDNVPSNIVPNMFAALRGPATYSMDGASNCRCILDRQTGYFAIFGTNIVNTWSYFATTSFPTDTGVLRNIINKNA